MTLAAVIVVAIATMVAIAIAAMVVFGLRRNSIDNDEGLRGQLAEVARHLNGEAEVPQKFTELVTRTKAA